MQINQAKILTLKEIAAVVNDLRRRRRYVNNRQTLIIVRLSSCAGLRASEVCSIRLDDVRVEIDKPHIRIRRDVGKGGKSRVVPLTWDSATLSDVREWKRERQAQGATPADYFVCSQGKSSFGRMLDRRNVRRRFITACRCLGAERQRLVTIHHGRHSFCSHALNGGRTLAEVRDAAGHANVSTTSAYLHTVGDDGTIGNLFTVN